MERLLAALEANTQAVNSLANSVNDMLVVIETGLDEVEAEPDPLLRPYLNS